MTINKYDLEKIVDEKKAKSILNNLGRHIEATLKNKYVDFEKNGKKMRALKIIREFDLDEALAYLKSLNDNREFVKKKRDENIAILEKIKSL